MRRGTVTRFPPPVQPLGFFPRAVDHRGQRQPPSPNRRVPIIAAELLASDPASFHLAVALVVDRRRCSLDFTVDAAPPFRGPHDALGIDASR